MAVAAVPAGGIADHVHPEPQGFVRRYVFSLDHKIIGIQYIITAFVFMVLADCSPRSFAPAAQRQQEVWRVAAEQRRLPEKRHSLAERARLRLVERLLARVALECA